MPALDKHDTPLPTTTVKWRFPSVHPEGRKFVVGSAAVTLLFFLLGWDLVAWILVGLTLWVAAFFRDPIRTTPKGEGLLPVVLALRQWAEEWGYGNMSVVLADRRDGKPVRKICVQGQDGRPLSLDELTWIEREEPDAIKTAAE